MLLSPWTIPNSDLGSWKPLHTIPKANGRQANPNAAKQKAAKIARKKQRRSR